MRRNVVERTHDAAGIAILDNQRRILLVHQTYGEKHWSFPGGVVENGESAYDAAIRECNEEISIETKDIELCGVYFMTHRNGYIFTFRTTRYDGQITVDNQEIGEYGFFGIDELP